ncbi:hypothetical protein [uncultured Brevundimonas sp.]|uniref:hypothetical protein n=1 Tax=uncultured Brevundimonas sp. TaxID=213418 RepID=UPI0026284315|nr:hypothetical protein [uncultured Brevundimonas sp.]
MALGIDEAEFLTVADPVIWIRRNGGEPGVGLPSEVHLWPEGDSVNRLADQFLVIGRSRGKSFHVRWGHYFPLENEENSGLVEISPELFSAYLIRRGALISRLAKFYRRLDSIEERTQARNRASKSEQGSLEALLKTRCPKWGMQSANPTYAVTAMVRQQRLSVFQARQLASSESQRLVLMRVRSDGSVIAVPLTFEGEQRFGRWRPRESRMSHRGFLVAEGVVREHPISDECRIELEASLSPSSALFDPTSAPSVLANVARFQTEAAEVARARASVSNQEAAECQKLRLRLVSLREVRALRDKLRIKRNVVRSAVRRTYERRARSDASKLIALGIPIQQVSDTY